MMKRILRLLLVGVFALGFIAGCGANPESEVQESNNETAAVEEPRLDDAEDLDTTVEDPDVPVSSTTEEEEVSGKGEDGLARVEERSGNGGQSPGNSGVEVIQKEVRLVGLADPHTVEVETDDGFIALQIDPRLAEKLGELPADTVLTIEYYQNEHGQFVLTDYKVH